MYRILARRVFAGAFTLPANLCVTGLLILILSGFPGRGLAQITAARSAPLPAQTIGIIVSGEALYYREVVLQIQHFLEAQYPDTRVSVDLASANQRPGSDPGLVVSVGTRAAEVALSRYPETPQLCIFITESAWQSLAQGTGATTSKAALFIDQPVERYLLLAKVIDPQATRVSTVLGPLSGNYRQRLEAAAAELDISLKLSTISRDSNPLAALTPLFATADLFIAIPDQGVINRNIARWALHLGFKNKVPVIGFSSSYTDAGATASVFTSPDDIARHANDWLDQYLSGTWERLWTTRPLSGREHGTLGTRLWLRLWALVSRYGTVFVLRSCSQISKL